MKSGALLLSLFLFVNQTVLAYSPESNFWRDRNKTSTKKSPLLHHHYNKILKDLKASPGSTHVISAPSELTNPTSPFVILIQDIHVDAEAQQNISTTLTNLIKSGDIGLIALEGAFGPIDLQRFKNYPDQKSVSMVAEYFFKKQMISGPLFTFLTQPQKLPTLVGIDDQNHYEANVKAFKDSVARQQSTHLLLDKTRQQINELISQELNPELKQFHNLTQRYHEGQYPLKTYIRDVAQFSRKSYSSLNLLIQLAQIEDSIDPKKLEQEKELFIKQRTPVDQHKNLQAFANFSVLSQKLNATHVFTDLNKCEQDIYSSLFKSHREKFLVEASQLLYYINNLTQFSLTKTEWFNYQQLKASFDQKQKIYKTNFFKNCPLSSFEKFYEEALLRDTLLSRNIEKVMATHQPKAMIALAGGFHSDVLIQNLVKKNIPLISFTPKLNTTTHNKSDSYLNVFLKEKTPLEKLYSGQAVALSPLQNDPSTLDMAGTAMVGAGYLNLKKLIDPVRLGYEFNLLVQKAATYTLKRLNNGVSIQASRDFASSQVEMFLSQVALNEIAIEQTVLPARSNSFLRKIKLFITPLVLKIAAVLMFSLILLSPSSVGTSTQRMTMYTLAWDRAASHTNLSAFILKWGIESGNYTQTKTVATNFTTTSVFVPEGGQYFFIVTAKNVANIESDPSNEIIVGDSPVSVTGIQSVNGFLLFNFSYKSIHGYRYIVETSTDLNTWVEANAVVESITPSSNSNFSVVKMKSRYRNVAGNRFFRVRTVGSNGGIMTWFQDRVLAPLSQSRHIAPYPNLSKIVKHLHQHYWAHASWIENLFFAYLPAFLLAPGLQSLLGLSSIPLTELFPFINALAWTLFSLVFHISPFSGLFNSRASTLNLGLSGLIAIINTWAGFQFAPYLVVPLSILIHFGINAGARYLPNLTLQIRGRWPFSKNPPITTVSSLSALAQAAQLNHQTSQSPLIIWPLLDESKEKALASLKNLAQAYLSNGNKNIYIEVAVRDEETALTLNQWLEKGPYQNNIHVLVRDQNQSMVELENAALEQQHFPLDLLNQAQFQILITRNTQLQPDFMAGISEQELSRYKTFMFYMLDTLQAIAVELNSLYLNSLQSYLVAQTHA